NYIYEGDAPLAERRAQALSIDQSQLEELLGDTDLRELLDPAALDEVEARLQALEPDYQARHTDGLHDLLLKLGDLSDAEVAARSASPEVAASVSELLSSRRAVRVRIAGESRIIAVEYAGRYRDALGTPLPPGLAEVFLEKSSDPLAEIIRRYARTHGPFTTADVAARYQLQPPAIETVLRMLNSQGKLLEGEFRPNGHHREWCDPEVLRLIRRKSLARLRREIEPVEQSTFVRFTTRWQGVTVPRRGLDALLDTIEALQGSAILASELETEILPARIADYAPGNLDTLMAAGEVTWVGVEQIGDRNGRIALYLTESLPLLRLPDSAPTTAALPTIAQAAVEQSSNFERAQKIAEFLSRHGASFFSEIHATCGGGFPGDTVDALWELAWAGKITNDTFYPLRKLMRPDDRKRKSGDFGEERPGSPGYLRRLRSRTASGQAHGRWSLLGQRIAVALTPTQWSANVSQQLLQRHGIVMRETAIAENIPGGYNTVYPALKTMEDSGWVRRGM
ncbi:MAG: crosslink repair DNA glycosylase YcaQ family protein, partial [Candidatus Acidiferrum sp.]